MIKNFGACMKSLVLVWLVLLCSSLHAKEYGLHFDDSGNIIKPDREYLVRGMGDEKDGFRESAMKNFMKAAEFGNYHAMSLVGLYHMQDKNYVAAHAWFNLIDLAQIPNRAYLEELIGNLEVMLTAEQLKEAQEMKAELAETYGSYPSMLRREAWKKSLKFTGTHIKGYIPPFLRIRLNSGMEVTGHEVRKQVDNFIYNYEFDFGQGEVTLDEIELIEVDEE